MKQFQTQETSTANTMRDIPNPLNIDVFKLEPEAIECWKAIFGMRGLTDEDLKRQAVVEKCFYSPDEIVFAMDCYSAYIKAHNFMKPYTKPDGSQGVMPLVPNQTNLARWLGTRCQTIYDCLDRHGEERHYKQYKKILSDLLSEGAMAGAYQASTAIFTLKNMCDWAEKYEDRTPQKQEMFTLDDAQELLEKLGYVKKDELPAPVKELGDGESVQSTSDD